MYGKVPIKCSREMKKLSPLISLVFCVGCGSQITSEHDIQAEVCDGKLYQLVQADKTHVSEDSYLLLKISCDTSQMSLTQVVANQKIKEQTTDIDLSFPDGLITLMDESGQRGNQLLSAEFPGEQLYFYISEPGFLNIDTGEEELVFQKFHLKTQSESTNPSVK